MSMNVKDLLTATAYDKDGDKVGNVNEVFVDDASGQPTFVDVNHGLFGMGNSLVPLRGHTLDGDHLSLAFAKDRIKDAPNFDVDTPLTPEQQTEIYRHYGVSEAPQVEGYTGAENPRGGSPRSELGGDRIGAAGAGAVGAGVDAEVAGTPAPAGTSADVDSNASDVTNAADRGAVTSNDLGTDPSSADNTLIRNEEHLNVGTERVETGEARLRKYVVTDTETVEVPVTREEVHVERTPISAEEAEAQAKSGGLDASGAEDASVTLHEERPVVNKETVPVEKVNLSTEEVSGTERVTEEVSKEQIDADGVDGFDDK